MLESARIVGAAREAARSAEDPPGAGVLKMHEGATESECEISNPPVVSRSPSEMCRQAFLRAWPQMAPGIPCASSEAGVRDPLGSHRFAVKPWAPPIFHLTPGLPGERVAVLINL